MSVTVVFVPLAAGAKFGSAALKTAYAECWPGDPVPAFSSKGKGNLTADFAGGLSVIAQVMPAPIPEGDLRYALRGTWLWPDAEDALADHRGHLVATTFGFADGDGLGRAELLTRFLAALFQASPQALGVLWYDAAMLVKGPLFADLAKSQLPATRPLWLWVNFQTGAGQGDRLTGATRGMRAFGHHDFETNTSSDGIPDLRDRLTGLCNYVLDNGPVINDGDTIGESADERIKVRHAKSLFGFEEEVMRLEYEPVKRRRR